MAKYQIIHPKGGTVDINHLSDIDIVEHQFMQYVADCRRRMAEAAETTDSSFEEFSRLQEYWNQNQLTKNEINEDKEFILSANKTAFDRAALQFVAVINSTLRKS